MPADINKTVQVDVRASLKDLLKKFKSLPGLTEKEAKEMAKGFQRQLRQTERAAKKAAQTNKKAMNQMGKSFDKAKTNAKNLRTQSRELGGSFSAMEDVISEVNPELAGMAQTIETVGMGARTLSRSLATGNVVLIALTAAIAAGVAAYTVFTSSSRDAAEQQKRLEEATKEVNNNLSIQASIVKGVQSDFTTTTRELAVFTGQMSKTDADIASAREANQRALDADLEKQDKIILNNQDLIKLARKAADINKELTEEEKERLNNAIALTEDKLLQGSLDSHGAAIKQKMFILEAHLQKENQRQLKLRKGIVFQRGEELEATEELIRLQKELQDVQEEEERRERQRAEAKARAREREAKLAQILSAIQQTNNQIEDKNVQLFSKSLSDRDQLVLKYEIEKEKLKEQTTALLDQLEIARETAKTTGDKAKLRAIEAEAEKQFASINEAQHLLEINRQDELAELAEKHKDQILKGQKEIEAEEDRIHQKKIKQMDTAIKASIGGIADFTRTGMELLTESGEENKTIIGALFRINQAAALADIAMSTAKGIARAPADYGPLAPLAIPAIAAGGAAQAAVVLSQTPPMHMGGIIAPDERQARVLTGESVLDRSTTRRLGDDGVRRLQNGGTMDPQVVVLNPYKHLDRYNRSAIRSQKSALKKFNVVRGAGRY